MPAVELEDKPLQVPPRESEEPSGERAKSDADFRCLVARSALVSHFSYNTVYQGNRLPVILNATGIIVPNAKLYWLDQLTKKVYITRNLRQVNVWKYGFKLCFI